MTPNKFPVISGPSKFDLSNGLFVWNPRRPVTFTASCPGETTFHVYILSVQAEDGSGESWNIEGVVGTSTCELGKESTKLFLPDLGQRVFLHFRTDSRKGHVNFFEKSGHRSLAAIDQIVQKINEEQFGDGSPVRFRRL